MVKARKAYLASIIALSLGTASSLASAESAKVTIDLSKQQYIGDVSELTRNKFFNIHTIGNASDLAEMDVQYLINELNADFGRGFWGPLSEAGTSDYPSTQVAMEKGAVAVAGRQADPKYNYISNRRVITEHPSRVLVDGNDPIEGARWAADYFQHYFDDETRPLFYEPMNEPFVHAHEFVDGPWNEEANQEMQRHMATWFGEIGKEFDTRGLDTQVVGFSSAWPSLELNDFSHWESRMKMFMDVAGEHMDGIAFHLYDGVNVTGQDNFRSGSNAEAIMDLQETYSYFKWDSIKPHAVTEYGGIVDGYADEYSPEKSSQELRSYNHILFSLLAREDRILTSIPFITGAARWYYEANNNNPYSATIFYPDPAKIIAGKVNGYLPTEKAKFFQLWSDVKGNRVDFTKADPDLAVQAFVYGNKVFIALNNHEDDAKQVDLSFVDVEQEITKVRTKRLDVPYNEAAIYSDTTADVAPSQITLAGHETAILEYTFAEPIEHDSVSRKRSYYNDNHIVPITAGNTMTFEFSDVEVDQKKFSFADSVADSIEYDAELVANLNPRLKKLYKFVLRSYNRMFKAVKRRYGENYEDSRLYQRMVQRVERSGFLRNALMLHYSKKGYNDGKGEVTLRMGISRKHDMSKQPVVTINGHAAEVPNDWAGYDQATREDFFGSIEIPVPAKFLKAHNTVNVTFDDTQGFVSSMILDVETEEDYQVVAVEGVELLSSEISINKDAIYRLKANVLPANASNKYVTWASSDTTVASVDEHGVVSAVAPGYVTITATTYDGEFVATANVEVEDKFTIRNTVTITTDLAEFDQTDTITANIAYTSDVDRDVVLSIFDTNNSWLKDERMTVPAGEGAAEITMSFESDLAAGEGYRILAGLHDVGGDWRTSVDSHTIRDIKVISTEPEIVDDGTVLSGQNLGFETGDFTDWVFAWNIAGTAEVSAEAANTGDYGTYINTTDGSVGLVVPGLPDGMMQAGKKFKLSFDVQRVSGEGWAGGIALLWNNAESWVSTPDAWFGTGTGGIGQWQTVEIEIDGIDWPATNTNLELSFRTPGQEWYLDNIKLEDITPDPSILAGFNSSFESGSLDPWVGFWQNNDTTTINIADYAASEGSLGLHVTSDGNSNTGITLPETIAPQDVGLGEGKQYTISFDVKSNNGSMTGWFRNVAQGAWDEQVPVWFSVDETWKTIELTIDQADWSSIANQARFDLYFNQNAGAGIDVYIDNIRVVEAEQPDDPTPDPVPTPEEGQVTVTVDLNVKQFYGNVSRLQRNKFFNIHEGFDIERNVPDQVLDMYVDEYNIGHGRQFWGPFAQGVFKNALDNGAYPTEQDAINAGASSKSTPLRAKVTNRVVITEHNQDPMYKPEVNDPIHSGEWAANYFEHYFNDDTRPLFYEPMNEPFVHTAKFAGILETWEEGRNIPGYVYADKDSAAVREYMTEIHKQIGIAFDKRPELDNVSVIGFADAYPSFENRDFANWDTRMKLFMDNAGEHVDAFSVHLYDGINVQGQETKRSGSNSQAILDLVETYSMFKFDQVKPHAITEYGTIVDMEDTAYDPVANSQDIKSITYLMMELLEREDRILTTIPFLGGYTEWFWQANGGDPYNPSVWRPNPDNIESYITQDTSGNDITRWRFKPDDQIVGEKYLKNVKAIIFDFWKGIDGRRASINNSDPDLQVVSFVEDDKAVVIMSNLEDGSKDVQLNLAEMVGYHYSSVKVERLKVPFDAAASLTETTSNLTSSVDGTELALGQIVLDEYESVKYTFTLDKSIDHTTTMQRQTYYSDDHLQDITENTAINFAINNVDLSTLDSALSTATLRVSIGRDIALSKNATVTFNGTAIEMPTDWAGYDQANRTDFFGAIEIPVDYALLQENNIVELTFSETGGKVSSVVLEVNNVVNDIDVTSVTVSSGNSGETSLKVNEAITIIASIAPAFLSDEALTWSSSDESIATVDQNGRVTAVSVGNVTIAATADNGVFGTLDVTVESLPTNLFYNLNGDLESGNIAPWSTYSWAPWTSGSMVTINSADPISGSYDLLVDTTTAKTQLVLDKAVLPSERLLPGHTYKLAFDFTKLSGDTAWSGGFVRFWKNDGGWAGSGDNWFGRQALGSSPQTFDISIPADWVAGTITLEFVFPAAGYMFKIDNVMLEDTTP